MSAANAVAYFSVSVILWFCCPGLACYARVIISLCLIVQIYILSAETGFIFCFRCKCVLFRQVQLIKCCYA